MLTHGIVPHYPVAASLRLLHAAMLLEYDGETDWKQAVALAGASAQQERPVAEWRKKLDRLAAFPVLSTLTPFNCNMHAAAADYNLTFSDASSPRVQGGRVVRTLHVLAPTPGGRGTFSLSTTVPYADGSDGGCAADANRAANKRALAALAETACAERKSRANARVTAAQHRSYDSSPAKPWSPPRPDSPSEDEGQLPDALGGGGVELAPRCGEAAAAGAADSVAMDPAQCDRTCLCKVTATASRGRAARRLQHH